MAARRDVIEHSSIMSLVILNQTTPAGQKRTAKADIAMPISPIITLMTCNNFDSFIFFKLISLIKFDLYYFNVLFFKSTALMATIIVLKDINTAAIAGSSNMPLKASAPAARGNATMLYPVAQKIF